MTRYGSGKRLLLSMLAIFLLSFAVSTKASAEEQQIQLRPAGYTLTEPAFVVPIQSARNIVQSSMEKDATIAYQDKVIKAKDEQIAGQEAIIENNRSVIKGQADMLENQNASLDEFEKDFNRSLKKERTRSFLQGSAVGIVIGALITLL